jgi:hypothetical protein
MHYHRSILRWLAPFLVLASLGSGVAVGGTAPKKAPPGGWKSKTAVFRRLGRGRDVVAPLDVSSNVTVPYFSTSLTTWIDKKTYTYTTVGPSPWGAKVTTPTTVSVVPILIRVNFPDATYDPSAAQNCAANSAYASFVGSPLIQPIRWASNGVDLSPGYTAGSMQFLTAFQRATLWNYVKNSNYGVTLSIVPGAPYVVDVTPASTDIEYANAVPCAPNALVATMDYNEFDAIARNVIARLHVQPNQLAVIMTYNVVFFDVTTGNCCYLGWHDAYAVSGGTQTYAVASYVDSGVFDGVDDVVTLGHELSEWMDDPFTQEPVPGGGSNNLTPAWGWTGQVAGCQNNLEVGDPLSGSEFEVDVNGVAYTMQDVAFRDWFYRSGSSGAGGLYSMFGLFRTYQKNLCQ